MISLVCNILLVFAVIPRESESQAPTILTAPENLTLVLEGDRVTLDWTYNLNGFAWSEVEFRTSGVPFIARKRPSESIRIHSEYLGRITANLTESFSSITFLAVNRTDSKIYEFVVENSVINLTAIIQVIVLYPPEITHISEHQILNVGDRVTLNCTAYGNPRPTVTWTRVSAGRYRCTADNGIGRPVTRDTIIIVLFPPVNVQLSASETTVCRGAVITFNCSAYANPMVHTYQLYENDVLLNESSSSGVWNRTLSTGGVHNFTCGANNAVGTTNGTHVHVNVNVSPSIPAIQNERVLEGDNLTLTCHVNGMPRPSVSWVRVSDGQRTNGSTLELTNTTRNQAGEYRCEAINPCANASEAVTITLHYPPEITHISGQQTLNVGDTVTLSCTANGNPTPTITWTRPSDNSVVTMPLVISGEQFEGSYRCTADNGIGRPVTRDTSIIVHFPASIVPLEDKLIFNKSDTVTLFCNVSGEPQPTVMWTHSVPTAYITMRTGLSMISALTTSAFTGVMQATSTEMIVTLSSFSSREANVRYSAQLEEHVENLGHIYVFVMTERREIIAKKMNLSRRQLLLDSK